MFDLQMLAAICGTFLLAGFVKGVVGLGLPTVSLALLTAVLGLPQAMALLLVPSFVTNLVQALNGGSAVEILRRNLPFFLLATATVWVGALALTRLDTEMLAGLLGAILVVYAGINLAGVRVDDGRDAEHRDALRLHARHLHEAKFLRRRNIEAHGCHDGAGMLAVATRKEFPDAEIARCGVNRRVERQKRHREIAIGRGCKKIAADSRHVADRRAADCLRRPGDGRQITMTSDRRHGD